MPCFKGIAVSVHANGAPLDEYGVQRQSRFSRISTYVPVPPPALAGADGTRPEPAKFAISITLLTPGIAVPYSTPKATETNLSPKPQYVGGLPSSSSSSSRYKGSIQPYIQMTNSDNETIAAYIYFDGRVKEEVATLLRPGEETWVNSRWVQVPESEGGGLAEREFLFREVGLERWLNGLDLTGHDAAEKLERRRQKFEKRRRRQREAAGAGGSDSAAAGAGGGDDKDAAAAEGMEVEDKAQASSSSTTAADTLRYGNNGVQMVEDDGFMSSSDDDDLPEATGQIKVAMFRVIASGEIKKGEYSPQFDAHDDDDEITGGTGAGAGKGGIDAEVEHTTSFAKPKSLDPKTISTQTVTGIDGPDKPYATFTFFYRGERQLQKMGILPSTSPPTANAAKRRSGQLDFSNLGPLKTTGTVGFSTFRDQEAQSARRKSHKRSNGSLGGMDEDSDEDDDNAHLPKIEDLDDKDIKPTIIEPEDPKSGELTDAINRIRLKRQHSVEPESASAAMSRKSPSEGPADASTPESSHGGGLAIPGPGAPVFAGLAKSLPDDSAIGSPLKKHRASIYEEDDRAPPLHKAQFSSPLADVLAEAQKKHDAAMAKEAVERGATAQQSVTTPAAIDEDEEL